jgi:hypothetical protein
MSIGPTLKKVVPICFLVGASMEFFMIKTGFYGIVTRKEGERMEEKRKIDEARAKRLKELNINLD